MSDAPRLRDRKPNRLNRPHAGQSLDPTLTRKGVLAHPGSLWVGFCALIFFAYVFNVGGLQVYLDGFFGGLDASAKSKNNEVATIFLAALPYLGVGLAALVLFLILSAMGRGAKRMGKKRKLSSRERVSLHEFIDEAAKHGVSKKVATEAYRQLLPHYHHEPSIRLSDRMTSSLQMKPVEVSDLYSNLLRRTDRQRKVGDDGEQLVTVLDLVEAVEASTVRSLTQSKLHLRQAKEGEAPVRKRPSLAHRMKNTIMRSVIRQAAPAAARKQDSFVKPYRPALTEAELAAKKAAAAKNETTAAN